MRRDPAPPPPLHKLATPYWPGFRIFTKWLEILAPDILNRVFFHYGCISVDCRYIFYKFYYFIIICNIARGKILSYPKGCPIDIAPPSTLISSISIPRILALAITTTANASLISHLVMSEAFNPKSKFRVEKENMSF